MKKLICTMILTVLVTVSFAQKRTFVWYPYEKYQGEYNYSTQDYAAVKVKDITNGEIRLTPDFEFILLVDDLYAVLRDAKQLAIQKHEDYILMAYEVYDKAGTKVNLKLHLNNDNTTEIYLFIDTRVVIYKCRYFRIK